MPMDTIWVAYIRDRRGSLYELNPKTYAMFKGQVDTKHILGFYDSQDKAERALRIVMDQIGWRGKSYHPNVWIPPDRYEYGWSSVPFNQFNTAALYSIAKFVER